MESAEVGIGAAKAEQEKIEADERKKAQFAQLIEKRREQEEATRKAMIENEQKRILEEDAAKAKEAQNAAAEQKQKEAADMEAALKKEVDEINATM